MLNKIFPFLICFLFLISFVSSQIHEQRTEVDLKVPFEVNGSMASGTAWCNISIQYPNSTFLKENAAMTNLGSGIFNITLIKEETKLLGEYEWVAFCCEGSECAGGQGTLKITATGKEFSEGQGIVSIGILLGALGLSFLFIILAFKLSQNPKFLPISFFFIILSLILGIYSLNLGYAFSHDILEYESLTPVTSGIYISFLWLIIGITIISMILMLFSFIKELGKLIKTRKFGENFNPVTDTYD